MALIPGTPTGSRQEKKLPSINLLRHDHYYEKSPRSLKMRLALARKTIKRQEEERRLNRQQMKRLRTKINSLKDIVKTLRKQISVSESGLACLESIAESDVSEFLQRYARNANKQAKGFSKTFKRQIGKVVGISRAKYPPAIRSFAMTLHFYSPKAYRYVRQKFSNALPEPSTLRSRYSTINCEPGFTSESFDALKKKVLEEKRIRKQVIVALMLDEMGIKKVFSIFAKGNLEAT